MSAADHQHFHDTPEKRAAARRELEDLARSMPATGSGKTTTLRLQINRLLYRGHPELRPLLQELWDEDPDLRTLPQENPEPERMDP